MLVSGGAPSTLRSMEELPTPVEQRRDRTSEHQWARVLYVAAAFPFVFFLLLSHGHGSVVFWLAPVVLCIAAAIWRSYGLWVILFGIYIVGSGAYTVLMIRDLLRLAAGESPQILLDFDDSAVFLALWVFLVGMTIALFRIRPTRSGDLVENPPTAEPPSQLSG